MLNSLEKIRGKEGIFSKPCKYLVAHQTFKAYKTAATQYFLKEIPWSSLQAELKMKAVPKNVLYPDTSIQPSVEAVDENWQREFKRSWQLHCPPWPLLNLHSLAKKEASEGRFMYAAFPWDGVLLHRPNFKLLSPVLWMFYLWLQTNSAHRQKERKKKRLICVHHVYKGA